MLEFYAIFKHIYFIISNSRFFFLYSVHVSFTSQRWYLLRICSLCSFFILSTNKIVFDSLSVHIVCIYGMNMYGGMFTSVGVHVEGECTGVHLEHL